MSSQARKRPRAVEAGTRHIVNELGEGELKRRLKLGGLKFSSCGKYFLVDSTRRLAKEIGLGLEANSEKDSELASEMVADVERAWNDDSIFRQFLLPFKNVESSCDYLFGKDTLTKVLLAVDAIQPHLLTAILQKIPELALAGEELSPASQSELSRLAVSQLKWIDYIVDGQQLTETLLSVISACPESVQRDLISVIPEIVDDKHHGAVAEVLITLLESNPELRISILQALSGLDLGEQASTACSIALRSLQSASEDSFPEIVKFVIDNTADESLCNVVFSLRRQLGKESLGQNTTKAVFEVLKTAFRDKHCFAEATLQALRDMKSQEQHPGDLWLMLALVAISPWQKKAEKLFIRGVNCGLITPALISAAFDPFRDALSELVRPLLSIGNASLQGNSQAAAEVTKQIYLTIFNISDGMDLKRDVIGALLEHIGSKQPRTVSISLASLIAIAKTVSLQPFLPFLEGLLDFLEFFDYENIGQIFRLLGRKMRNTIIDAFTSMKMGITIDRAVETDNDQLLEIILRKELTHVDQKYRHIGVIGACNVLQVFSENEESLPSAKIILNLLLASIEKDRDSEALAYRRIAQFCKEGNLHRRLSKSIRNSCLKVFEARFARAADKKPSLDFAVECEARFNLDREDATISLPLVELAQAGRHSDALVLCSIAKVLCDSTKFLSNGSLEDIDAILGCPLWLPTDNSLANFSSASSIEQTSICISFVLASQWIRAIVNSFVSQEIAAMRESVLNRLRNLAYIESSISPLIEENGSSKLSVNQYLNVKSSRTSWRSPLERLDFSVVSLLSKLNFSEAGDAKQLDGDAAELLLTELELLCSTMTFSENENAGEAERRVQALVGLRRVIFQTNEFDLDDEDQIRRLRLLALKSLSSAVGKMEEILRGLSAEEREGHPLIAATSDLQPGSCLFQLKEEVERLCAEDSSDIDIPIAAEICTVLCAVARRCKDIEMGQRISTLLKPVLSLQYWESADKKTLESVWPRFLRIRISLAEKPVRVLAEALRQKMDNLDEVLLNLLLSELEAVARSWVDDFQTMRDIIAINTQLTQQSREFPKALHMLMKCGNSLSHLFTTKFVPVLRQNFKSRREDCIKAIKDFQKSTRILQSLCSHAKALKDSSLTLIVPRLKQRLERVIFNVKALLEENSESSLFWVGNLKHRSLDGEVVNSQVDHTQATQHTEPDSDEENSPRAEVQDPAEDEEATKTEYDNPEAEDEIPNESAEEGEEEGSADD